MMQSFQDQLDQLRQVTNESFFLPTNTKARQD